MLGFGVSDRVTESIGDYITSESVLGTRLMNRFAETAALLTFTLCVGISRIAFSVVEAMIRGSTGSSRTKADTSGLDPEAVDLRNVLALAIVGWSNRGEYQMSQDSLHAIALHLVGIIVVLAGMIDTISESLSPVGEWLIPAGSVFVAASVMAYTNAQIDDTLFDVMGPDEDTADDDPGDEPFEDATYRVGKGGEDTWTWSLDVKGHILAMGTIQYPSRDSAVKDVKRFQRLGEDVPIAEADDDITEFTEKLLSDSSVDTHASSGGENQNRRYYVVYKGGEWKVRLESGPVIDTMGSDRSGAISRAKELGRRHDRSVMVNYKDGRLGAAYFDQSDL